MVVSKREQNLAIATGAILGAGILYLAILQPLWDRKVELDKKIKDATSTLDLNKRTVAAADRLGPRWTELHDTILKKDASSAEALMLHHVLDWAQAAGLNLTSVKPERTEKEGDYLKVTLRASASGRMSEVSRFLYRVQQTEIPVSITEVQITSRKEGSDDLSVQVGLATIYFPADADKPKAAPVTKEQI